MARKETHIHKESEGKVTIDHDVIRDWIVQRSGIPSIVKNTIDIKGSEILKINFEDKKDDLEEVTWEIFFEIFEDNELAFLHQEETIDGNQSRFYKFIDREQFKGLKKD